MLSVDGRIVTAHFLLICGSLNIKKVVAVIQTEREH